jgi:hypothetical protein
MTAIQDAIAEIERMGKGVSFSYTKVAKDFKVDRSTLARRHKGKQAPRAVKAAQQQKLNPQQEEELIIYIGEITERGLPPTREMIKNFASAVAESDVGESWVSCFLMRHKTKLTSKMNFYTTKMTACALLLQPKRSMARRAGLWIFNSAKNIMEVQYSGLQGR